MNKIGQISMFVIIAILIVAAIIVFFVVYQNRSVVSTLGEEFDPESFISKCVRDSVRENIDIMLPQGGFLEPTDYKLYQDNKVAYSCKNVNFYDPCITQYPRYITRLQEELKLGIEEDVGNCFILLEEELNKKNYDVQGGQLDMNVVLKPGIVEIVVLRNLQLSKNGNVRDFTSFKSSIKSHIYDLAYVANEIARQEATYCYFAYAGYSILYPEFDIRKFSMSDATKIYSIKYKQSGEILNTAIRGCAIPAGF